METQSARVGHYRATPYPLPGRENAPIDRTASTKEPFIVNFDQERKDRFTGHELITWEDGAITDILRPPRKPIFTSVKKLERMITQTEHKIKNVHVPEIEKLKSKNLFSEVERVQRVIDAGKGNIKAWQAEIRTAEEAAKDYALALVSLNKKIRDAIK